MCKHYVCLFAVAMSVPLGCSLETGAPETESEPAAAESEALTLALSMCQIAPKDDDCTAGSDPPCSSSDMPVPYWQVDKPGCYHQWLVGWGKQQIIVYPQWDPEAPLTYEQCQDSHLEATGYVETSGTWHFYSTKMHGVPQADGTCGSEFDPNYGPMFFSYGDRHRTAMIGYHYVCAGQICAKIYDQVSAHAQAWKLPEPI